MKQAEIRYLDEGPTISYYGYLDTTSNDWYIMRVSGTEVGYHYGRYQYKKTSLATAWADRSLLVYSDPKANA